MTATPSINGTTASTFGVNVLRAVLADAEQREPGYGQRWQRAAAIVALRRIAPALAASNVGRCYWVEASGGSTEYFVSQDARENYRFDACTCPDYQQRGGPCKHALAVRLYQRCTGRGETPPPPIPFPVPTLDPHQPIPFTLTAAAEAALDTPEPVPAA
jgi:hypothetical protein